MRWHIIGAAGYIGTKMIEYLPEMIKPFCYDMVGKGEMKTINLEHAEEMDFSVFHPGDFVVFLAAISSPDVCKNRYDFAWRINVEGTTQWLERLLERGTHVLFFSSDVVYGETDLSPRSEEGKCVPCGPYAEMKHEIERRFSDRAGIKFFRLSYVYSRTDKFSIYMDQCTQTGKTAIVYDTLYRNVVYINDIFDAVIALSQKFEEFNNSVFNLCGPELLSRRDLAQLYKQFVRTEFEFSTALPPEGFFEARPPMIATRSMYLEKLLGRKATRIADAMCNEYKAKN